MTVDYSQVNQPRPFIPDPSFSSIQDISSALGQRARVEYERKESIQDALELARAKANLESVIEKERFQQQIGAASKYITPINQGFKNGQPQPDSNISGGEIYGQSQYILNPNFALTGKGDPLIVNPMFQSGQDIIKEQRKIQNQVDTASAKEYQVNLSKLNRLDTIVDTIKTKWEKTTPPGTRTTALPIVGRGLASLSAIGARLQATKGQRKDSAYLSFIKGIRAQIARSLGDVGNLSEFEQKSVLDLIPSINDSYDVGLEKIENIKSLIENIRSNQPSITQNLDIKKNDDPLGIR